MRKSAVVSPAALAALAARPDLWPTALGVGLRLAVPGWWRRWPPVPAPGDAYARFRLQTMYGSCARVGGRDLVAYLEWCRRMRGLR